VLNDRSFFWCLDVGGWNFSSISHLITNLGIPGQQIGHDIIIVLRAGDFHLTDFQIGPINVEVLVDGRKMADRKVKDYKSRARVDEGNFSDKGTPGCYNQFLIRGVCTRLGERAICSCAA
jgi:hypothetical protein